MLARLLSFRRRPVFETVFLVAVAVGLALAVQAYAVKPYQIPSGSMKPTLQIGERVLVERFSTRLGGDPQPGDIIVFHPPASVTDPGQPSTEPSDDTFIKRVVAGPGDTVRIEDGIPIVNGRPFTGDFETVPCRGESGCDMPDEVTVPDDHYFVLGDNRPDSKDSRFWGPLPREWIIGRAVFAYWPPDQAGTL